MEVLTYSRDRQIKVLTLHGLISDFIHVYNVFANR